MRLPKIIGRKPITGTDWLFSISRVFSKEKTAKPGSLAVLP